MNNDIEGSFPKLFYGLKTRRRVVPEFLQQKESVSDLLKPAGSWQMIKHNTYQPYNPNVNQHLPLLERKCLLKVVIETNLQKRWNSNPALKYFKVNHESKVPLYLRSYFSVLNLPLEVKFGKKPIGQPAKEESAAKPAGLKKIGTDHKAL